MIQFTLLCALQFFVRFIASFVTCYKSFCNFAISMGDLISLLPDTRPFLHFAENYILTYYELLCSDTSFGRLSGTTLEFV